MPVRVAKSDSRASKTDSLRNSINLELTPF